VLTSLTGYSGRILNGQKGEEFSFPRSLSRGHPACRADHDVQRPPPSSEEHSLFSGETPTPPSDCYFSFFLGSLRFRVGAVGNRYLGSIKVRDWYSSSPSSRVHFVEVLAGSTCDFLSFSCVTLRLLFFFFPTKDYCLVFFIKHQLGRRLLASSLFSSLLFSFLLSLGPINLLVLHENPPVIPLVETPLTLLPSKPHEHVPQTILRSSINCITLSLMLNTPLPYLSCLCPWRHPTRNYDTFHRHAQ